jgi:hypothetical protein
MELDLEGDGKTDPWISPDGYEFINPKNSTSSTR